MNWKKFLLIGAGWGVGTAVGLALIVGGVFWYESRPKPPKPWNNSAIRAEFDYMDTEGDKNTIVFWYVLENTTDFDYRVQDNTRISTNAVLEQQRSLSPFNERVKADFPILIPAKKRVRYAIHLDDDYNIKRNPDAALPERRKYHADLANYITTKFTNLDGFDFLDESNRYEIIFPSGWKEKKENKK